MKLMTAFNLRECPSQQELILLYLVKEEMGLKFMITFVTMSFEGKPNCFGSKLKINFKRSGLHLNLWLG